MINTQNFYCSGSLQSTTPISISTNTASNISFISPLSVTGNITTSGSLIVGQTLYANYRLTENISMNANEFCYDFPIDSSASDITAITTPNEYIYDHGVLTVPMSGLYSLTVQGSFLNSVPEATNGVYFYLKNSNHPECRISAELSQCNIISTSIILYLKQNDIIQPTFYSSDPNTILLADKGETLFGLTILHTTAIA